MSAAPGLGPITLTVPADASMTRVARLTASSLAAMAQMTLDDIDDIKILVSEVVTALVEHGTRGPITLTFHIGDDELRFSGQREATGLDRDHPDVVMTDTVLAAVSDDHSIDLADGSLAISASKRASANAAS
jgi:anti-sigma regulatory factor (Ser/Thr protein kinase)